MEEPLGIDGVVSLWESIVDHTLTPERRAAFRARQETSELAECARSLLRLSGEELMEHEGVLLLEQWLSVLPTARRRMSDVGRTYTRRNHLGSLETVVRHSYDWNAERPD